MLWASVALGTLLLVALLVSFLEPRLTRGRRARGAHRGDVVHWYPNYDEDLRFEPRYEHDIVTISRSDLQRFGYTPGDESAPVPRTFRGRVAGDHRLRLWTSPEDDLRSIWVCCWRSAIELPAAVPTPSTRPLTREMLVSISNGPHPGLDDERSTEMPDNRVVALADWDEARLSDSIDESPSELIHEADRLYCTETTPLSSASREDSLRATEADEVIDVVIHPTPKSKGNRGRRRRKGRRR